MKDSEGLNIFSPTLSHTMEYDLFNEDGEAQWKEHQDGTNITADVVILPINIPENFVVMSINESMKYSELVPNQFSDIYIGGYPWGLKINNLSFPIWKKGSFAYDPDISLENLDCNIVEISTANGSSGSPCFMSYHGFIFNNGKLDEHLGHHLMFLGIYSGRISKEYIPNNMKNSIFIDSRSEEDNDIAKELNSTNLGMVWRANTLHKIVEKHKLDIDMSAIPNLPKLIKF